MNINIKMNVINQYFIIEQSKFLLNINLSKLIWMNDQNVYYYDIYKMHYWFTDSWSIIKNTSIFYVIDKKESSLILNILSMQKKYIWINMIFFFFFFFFDSYSIQHPLWAYARFYIL